MSLQKMMNGYQLEAVGVVAVDVTEEPSFAVFAVF